jgi:O-antigen ligase
VGIVIVIALLAVPLRSLIVDRLSNDDNGAAASRIPLSQIAFLMIEDHPVSGVGANNYALFMTPYAARSGHIGEFRYTVHNTYFLTWAETGIGGLIALVWLLIAIARQGIKCWQFHDPLYGPLALGCAAAVIGFMFQLGVDIFRTGSAMDLMWLFGGLVTAMTRMSADKFRVPQPCAVIGERLIDFDFGRPTVASEGQS